MRKHIIAAMVALFMGVTISFAQSYTRSGNEFSSVKKERVSSSSKDAKTGYTWKDSKGNVYDIYISSRGSCYIIRTSSKTGKEYKDYLPKEVSEQIKKELKK